MTEQHQPSPDDSFGSALRESARILRSERGDCPQSAMLLAYATGTLAAADAARLEAHLERCGICDLVTTRLKIQRGSAFLWKTALPLCALCIGIAAAWFFYGRPFPRATVTQASLLHSANFLDLDATRSVGGPVASQSAGRWTVLSFFMPLDPKERYTAVIRNGSGVEVARESPLRSYDGMGNCVLLLDSERLSAGTHTLSVDGAGQRFNLDFTLRK